jgi:DNA-binding transcriptional MerR regulator/effector-binding domain-containing protein
MTSRVTIGDFSRASHLSVKTLRHYHEVGLLEPNQIDPDNGYRYYTEDQIPLAQVIRRLRGLQMPVADVRAVLSTADLEARNGLIVEHLNRLEAELARTRTAVGELRRLLERPERERPIEHRSVPPTPAIAIDESVDRDDILPWWQGALGELQATALAQGLSTTGPCGGLYAGEIFQHGRGQATVFLPVSGSVRTVGRVVSLVIPAAELAVMRHDGALENIDLTYGELGGYVMRHEIGVDGPLRENYLRGFLDSDDPGQWETEIAWPIFRSDPPGGERRFE